MAHISSSGSLLGRIILGVSSLLVKLFNTQWAWASLPLLLALACEQADTEKDSGIRPKKVYVRKSSPMSTSHCQKSAPFGIDYPGGGETFCAGDTLEVDYRTGSNTESVYYNIMGSIIDLNALPLATGRDINDGHFGLRLPGHLNGVVWVTLRDDCDIQGSALSKPFWVVQCPNPDFIPEQLPIAQEDYFVVRKGIKEEGLQLVGMDYLGRTLTWQRTRSPQNGSMQGPDSNGVFTYRADGNYERAKGATAPDDFFQFRVRAGGKNSNIATVQLWFSEPEVTE